MKISLTGLSGCGKTSLYSVALYELLKEDIKKFSPKILFKTRSHPFLGLQFYVFDLENQDGSMKENIKELDVFQEINILILVVDLHDPNRFKDAKNYFKDLLELQSINNEKLKVYLFFHKNDIEEYQKKQLDINIEKAKETFSDLFKDYEFTRRFTSIYEIDKLTKIFRNILITTYDELKYNIETSEEKLEEIKAIIIITDISGNVIVHNVKGNSGVLNLRSDLREFLNSCNVLRENLFISDSAVFEGQSKNQMEIILYIFKEIICIFVMKSRTFDKASQEKLNSLIEDIKLFANLVISVYANKIKR